MKVPFRTKICGVTNFVDGKCALECGADALGLNFYSRSLRWLARDVAADLAARFRQIQPGVCLVGVFVNETPDAIRETAEACALQTVQLHGDEPESLVAALEGWPIMRAIRVHGDDFKSAREEIDRWQQAGVHSFLVDAAAGTGYGGTGRKLDWKQVRELKAATDAVIVLAGGLTPSNVAEAIATARPDAVDVASGVEGLPAKKDPNAVRAFVEEARQAFEGLARSGYGS